MSMQHFRVATNDGNRIVINNHETLITTLIFYFFFANDLFVYCLLKVNVPPVYISSSDFY